MDSTFFYQVVQSVKCEKRVKAYIYMIYVIIYIITYEYLNVLIYVFFPR